MFSSFLLLICLFAKSLNLIGCYTRVNFLKILKTFLFNKQNIGGLSRIRNIAAMATLSFLRLFIRKVEMAFIAV